MTKAAPVGPPGTFSKADWQEIKRSLAKIGVDLDTKCVGAELFTGKLSWLSSGPGGPGWALFGALQQIAYFYTLPKAPTANQRAGRLKDLRTALEVARRKLRSAEGERLFNYPDVPSDVTRDRELYDLMTWKVAQLDKRIPKLRVIGSNSRFNRLTMLGDYCGELTRLWQACGDGRLHKNALRQFLLACSRAPFVEAPSAKLTTEELEQKIKSFLSNQ